MLSFFLTFAYLSVFATADSSEESYQIDQSAQADSADQNVVTLWIVAAVVLVAFILFICLICCCKYCCCNGDDNKDIAQPLSYDFNHTRGQRQGGTDKSTQIIEEPRSCNDIICLLIFFLFCIAILVFFIIGFTQGNPKDAVDPINSLFACCFILYNSFISFSIFLFCVFHSLLILIHSVDISVVEILRVLTVRSRNSD